MQLYLMDLENLLYKNRYSIKLKNKIHPYGPYFP